MLNIFQRQALPAFQQWSANEPLLNAATGLANQNLANLPGYQSALTAGYNTAQGAIPGLTNMVQGAYTQGQGITQNLPGMIQSAYQGATPTSQLTAPLLNTYSGYLSDIVGNQGALPGGLARQARQEAFGAASGAGMAHSNAGVFADALNQQRYRDARYNTALNQMLGVGNQISGLDTAALQRALGASSGIDQLATSGLQRAQGAAGSLYGLAQAPFQNALNYANANQGLLSGAQQQLYGAEMAPIGAWQALFNPTGQNVADVLNYNLNAQNAANIANSNKTGSVIGGGLNAIGRIAGSYS